MPTPIEIVPILSRWNDFSKAFTQRGLPTPACVGGGIAAVTDRGDFAAGCLLFNAERLLIAEYLVTNPEIPMWERHAGVAEMARSLQTHSAAACKTLWIMVRHQSLARVLKRAGYQTNGAVCFQGRW